MPNRVSNILTLGPPVNIVGSVIEVVAIPMTGIEARGTWAMKRLSNEVVNKPLLHYPIATEVDHQSAVSLALDLLQRHR
jgi:hypothetical protein